jgi:hypothetical protein
MGRGSVTSECVTIGVFGGRRPPGGWHITRAAPYQMAMNRAESLLQANAYAAAPTPPATSPATAPQTPGRVGAPSSSALKRATKGIAAKPQ